MLAYECSAAGSSGPAGTRIHSLKCSLLFRQCRVIGVDKLPRVRKAEQHAFARLFLLLKSALLFGFFLAFPQASFRSQNFLRKIFVALFVII